MTLRSFFKSSMLVPSVAASVTFITLIGILIFIFYNSDGGRDWGRNAPVLNIISLSVCGFQ